MAGSYLNMYDVNTALEVLTTGEGQRGTKSGSQWENRTGTDGAGGVWASGRSAGGADHG